MSSIPQNPPFAFPDRAERTTAWHALGKPDGALIKDDGGTIILMGYCGPTPEGKTKHGMYIVTHAQHDHIHPAGKYAFQRYRESEAP